MKTCKALKLRRKTLKLDRFVIKKHKRCQLLFHLSHNIWSNCMKFQISNLWRKRSKLSVIKISSQTNYDPPLLTRTISIELCKSTVSILFSKPLLRRVNRGNWESRSRLSGWTFCVAAATSKSTLSGSDFKNRRVTRLPSGNRRLILITPSAPSAGSSGIGYDTSSRGGVGERFTLDNKFGNFKFEKKELDLDIYVFCIRTA